MAEDRKTHYDPLSGILDIVGAYVPDDIAQTQDQINKAFIRSLLGAMSPSWVTAMLHKLMNVFFHGSLFDQELRDSIRRLDVLYQVTTDIKLNTQAAKKNQEKFLAGLCQEMQTLLPKAAKAQDKRVPRALAYPIACIGTLVGTVIEVGLNIHIHSYSLLPMSIGLLAAIILYQLLEQLDKQLMGYLANKEQQQPSARSFDALGASLQNGVSLIAEVYRALQAAGIPAYLEGMEGVNQQLDQRLQASTSVNSGESKETKSEVVTSQLTEKSEVEMAARSLTESPLPKDDKPGPNKSGFFRSVASAAPYGIFEESETVDIDKSDSQTPLLVGYNNGQ